MRVLYLYSGKRKGKRYGKGKMSVDYPDTQFYGLNHLKKYGLKADYREFEDVYPSWLGKFLSFRLRHFLMFFATKGYDLVFGSSLIYLLPWRIIFRTKTKFVLLNIYLNRLLTANKKNFFKFYFIKFLIRKLDAVICLANIQRKYLIENYGFSQEKIFFVPLGADIYFHQYTPDEKRDDFILSAGSDDGRDYQTVLKVAKICPDLKFIIVCGQKNMAKIDKGEIPENIEIQYYISSKELRNLYQRARIFLLVTYPDGYTQGADCSGQTVLLDALASGLPIIANKKAYLTDYVENNKEIVITESNSPQILKEKIELLLGNRELRKKLAQAGRSEVENNFSSQHMAKRLADCFRTI